MRKLWQLTVLAVVVWCVWVDYVPHYHPPGVLIREEPEQLLLNGAEAPFASHGWVLKPLAIYSIKARVLSKASYFGTRNGELAPYDLAVGWGPMSDSAVLRKLEITQSGRWYHWQYWGDPPAPRQDIISHSANMHLIPDNDTVRSAIGSLRVGALVEMKGYLVEARRTAPVLTWRSSLRRDDTGDGSCELMLVRSLREW